MGRNIAQDCDADAVGYELLKKLAGDAGAKAEEIVAATLGGNHDQARAVAQCLADDSDGVETTHGRAFEDASAVQVVAFWHFSKGRLERAAAAKIDGPTSLLNRNGH